MTPTELQKHFRLTYLLLRLGLGVLAAFFPVFLVTWGYFIEHIPPKTTMSDYYFAFAPADSPLRVFPMRVFFVGILWAIGCFLILYRGFSDAENRLLNLAGFCAIAVACIPTSASCSYCVSAADLSGLHTAFAIAFFACLTLVALFCSKNTLDELVSEQTKQENELKEGLGKSQDAQQKEELGQKLLDLQRKHKLFHPDHFRTAYNWLGALMILAPLAVVGMTYFAHIYDWVKLAAEWTAIWVFAAYWLVKTYELSRSKADDKAMTGELTVTEPTAEVSEATRQLYERIRNGSFSKIANLRGK